MAVPIATPAQLASSLQRGPVDTASAELYLELAQGLIASKIGEQDPWPAVAKSVALAAAGRAYDNPTGASRRTAGPFTTQQEAARMGVYLTAEEEDDLAAWLTRGRGKVGTIRTTSAYPPVAECDPRWV